VATTESQILFLHLDEEHVVSTVTSQKLICAEFYKSPHRPGPDHAMPHKKNFMSQRTCGSCDHSHVTYVLTFSAYLAACQKDPREIIYARLPQYDIYMIYIYIYTECPRRNVPDFGRVFLRSNYTDITQNTSIQSSMVTEILAREKCGFLWCLHSILCP